MARSRFGEQNPRERLVYHVQELERLEHIKKMASEDLKEGFAIAKQEGYDTVTLKVVLKLRKMTPDQRQERRALEAIYMAALGMLEGDSLPEAARRRLDGPSDKDGDQAAGADGAREAEDPAPPEPAPTQQPLIVKDPAEAYKEGVDSAAAGKRIYDNPYPAGDPCRAAWDEGWCSQQQSHGMGLPAAYQRRSEKPPKKDEEREPGDQGVGDAGDAQQRGAA